VFLFPIWLSDSQSVVDRASRLRCDSYAFLACRFLSLPAPLPL